MNNEKFVQALQEVFDANDPFDGIDRHDGYGRDYRIESPRIVGSDDGFDNLEVIVRIGRRTRRSRLLFDRAWREASGLDNVGAYAAYVVARWQFSTVGSDRSADVTGAEEAVPGADEPWGMLLDGLRRAYDHIVMGEDLIEAFDDVGRFFVHVTPQQWRRFAAKHVREALAELDELIDSRWDDEDHIVFFRGELHQSIRAELPPVRSMLLRESAEAVELYAVAPDDLDGRP